MLDDIARELRPAGWITGRSGPRCTPRTGARRSCRGGGTSRVGHLGVHRPRAARASRTTFRVAPGSGARRSATVRRFARGTIRARAKRAAAAREDRRRRGGRRLRLDEATFGCAAWPHLARDRHPPRDGAALREGTRLDRSPRVRLKVRPHAAGLHLTRIRAKLDVATSAATTASAGRVSQRPL